MNETTYTPGPWEVDAFESAAIISDGATHSISAPANDSDRYLVAETYPLADAFPGAPDVVGDANARLIAAAPDLLAACRLAARSLHHPECPNDGRHCTCHVGAAIDAITKAGA